METKVVDNRYELLNPIGRGHMATVYLAKDVRLERMVAAKILREVHSTNAKFTSRFKREALIASQLVHPNVVQILDFGLSDESYFIIMELVDGVDLKRYLNVHGILTNEQAIAIVHLLALGLGAAHERSIIHRGVKPQNILVSDDGRVKLADFGTATMYLDAQAERLTTITATLGNVEYLAPEQVVSGEISPAEDICALGIVMYEMLTGRRPFSGDGPFAVALARTMQCPMPPRIYNSTITRALEEVIMCCLQREPSERYPDGNALAKALEAIAYSTSRRRSVMDPELWGSCNGPANVQRAMKVSRIPKSRIFVSHHHTDAAFSQAFVAMLRALEFDVWYDQDDLTSGALRNQIERELRFCDDFIVILSPEAVRSEWVNAEIDAALELMRSGHLRTFLPIVAIRCDIPLLLRRYKRIERIDGGPVTVREAVERTLQALTTRYASA